VCSDLGYVYLKQFFVGGPLGERVRLAVFSRGLRDERGKAENTCSAAVSNSAEGICVSRSLLASFLGSAECVVKF